MAHAIALAEAARRGLEEVRVASAGTAGGGGHPAAAHAREVVREHGLDLDEHRSRGLDLRRLREADRILAMSPGHVEAVRHWMADAPVELLGAHLPEEDPDHGSGIPDPIGGGREEYERTYRILREAIRGLFDRLEAEGAFGTAARDPGEDASGAGEPREGEAGDGGRGDA